MLSTRDEVAGRRRAAADAEWPGGGGGEGGPGPPPDAPLSPGLPTNTTVNTAQPTPISTAGKVCATLGVYGAFLGMGLGSALLGTALPQLAQQAQLSLWRAGLVISSQGVGRLLGTLGAVFMHLRSSCLLPLTVFVLGASVLAVPWCNHWLALGAAVVVNGIGVGALVTGTILFCVHVWNYEGMRHIQTTCLVTIIGASLAPLLMQPFLVDHEMTGCVYVVQPEPTYDYDTNYPVDHQKIKHILHGGNNVETVTGGGQSFFEAKVDSELIKWNQKLLSLQLQSAENTTEASTPPPSKLSVIMEPDSNGGFLTTDDSTVVETGLVKEDIPGYTYVFLMTAILLILSASVLVTVVGRTSYSAWLSSKLHLPTQYIRNNWAVPHRYKLLILFSLILFGHSAFDFTYGQFLLSYTSTKLCWNFKESTNVSALFWGTQILGFAACFFLSSLNVERIFLGIDNALLILFAVIVVVLVPFFHEALWVCSALLGLILSCTFCHCLTLAIKVLPLNRNMIGVMLVVANTGTFVVPAATALLLPLNSASFSYMLLGAAVISAVSFCVLHRYIPTETPLNGNPNHIIQQISLRSHTTEHSDALCSHSNRTHSDCVYSSISDVACQRDSQLASLDNNSTECMLPLNRGSSSSDIEAQPKFQSQIGENQSNESGSSASDKSISVVTSL